MNIMLLGNTGSGKSTLAGLLASRHNFKHVNTGRLTRPSHINAGLKRKRNFLDLQCLRMFTN